eukprot:m.454862 g.454862  ORF g.454862 m.454862 type:complete len:892 (+) comp20757_c0_seq1:166-2841(+)
MLYHLERVTHTKFPVCNNTQAKRRWSMDAVPTRRSSGRKQVAVARFDVDAAREEQAIKAAIRASEKLAKEKERQQQLNGANGHPAEEEDVPDIVVELPVFVDDSIGPSRSSSAASSVSKSDVTKPAAKRRRRKPKAAPSEPAAPQSTTQNRPQGTVARGRPTVPQIRQEVGVSATDFVSFFAQSVGNLESYIRMPTDLAMKSATVKQVPLQTSSRSEKRAASGSSGGAAAEPGKRRRTQASKPVFEAVPTCPVYHPTAMEFAEPLDYIASIRDEAEKFGICRIVPPPQWQPTCQVSETSEFTFRTRLQHIHRLFKRNGPNRHFLDCLREHLRSEGSSLEELPVIGGVEVDLYWLSMLVAAQGGLQSVINRKLWGAIAADLKIPRAPERDARLQACYYQYLLSYDTQSPEEKKLIEGKVIQQRVKHVAEDFGYGDGPGHTMPSFKKYADDFKQRWFGARDDVTLNDIEREYWSIVDQGDKHVGVCYGSDIDTTKHGSGFATNLDDPYSRFGWNLNVLPGLEGSILKHVSGISGISMPWLYVGMLFSTFAWHNEDNYLYSINYHHFGAPKQWYGVPGSGAAALEASFRSQMPDEFEKRPLLLHDLVTMVSPEILRQDGVPVCRTVQQAGEFVVTFPQSYHAGFSYGFNCGEAVNFASADWIPFGHKAITDYSSQRRPVSLNQEHLILSTAKLERNSTTLLFTVAELEAIRERERKARGALVERGVRQTTFEIFSGGQSRDLGSGNIFQQRLTAKMHINHMARGGGGRMGGPMDRAGAAGAIPEAGAARADISAVNTKGSTLTSPVCEVCAYVCHISMVILQQKGVRHAMGDKHRIRCTHCTLTDSSLGREALGWTTDPRGADKLVLVCRYSLEELDELVVSAKKRLGAAPMAT